MEIQRVSIEDLVPDPQNARFHPEENIEAIRRSLERFGQVAPIVVHNETSIVVSGNGTLEAMKRLGWTECGIVAYDGTQDEARALAIAMNRTGETSKWDETSLAKVVNELQSANFEGIEAIGFDAREMESVIAGFGTRLVQFEASVSRGIENDEVPEPPTRPVTQPGDVWELGRHTLICSDCREVPFDPKSVKLMVTDPPYGVSYAAKNEFLNAVAPGNRIQVPIEGDHQTPEEMSKFWVDCFTAVRPAMVDGASYYVTGPQGGDLLLLLLLALRESGFPLHHMLVWAKNNHVLGRCDYHYQHEPIVYGWVEGSHHAVENRSETSLWQIDKPQKSDLHPTMKPVALYARAIGNSSNEGDVVLDPFSGSGTCVVACEQLGRRCLAVELSPAYCDVIIERWQTLTGEKAQRS